MINAVQYFKDFNKIKPYHPRFKCSAVKLTY